MDSTQPTLPTNDDSILPFDQLQRALQAAETGTWNLDVRQQRVWWDDRCKQLYGFRQDDIVSYEQLWQCVHPDDRPAVDEAVQWALNPTSDGRYDVQFRTVGAGDGQLRWLRCQGQAYFDERGTPYRFAGIAQDNTAEMKNRRALETSKARFRNLVADLPTATIVFTGRDMRVEAINEAMLNIWGKDEAVVGKRLHEALPELEGQPFLELLQRVYDTGIPYRNPEGKADLMIDGRLQTFWFNYAYNPLYDEDGAIYGVINTATEITRQVVAIRQYQQAQQALQRAVDLAQLGIWQFEVPTGNFTCSERIQEWLGLAEQINPQDLSQLLSQDEMDRVDGAFQQAYRPETGGRLDIEYRINNAQTEQPRVLRSVGQVEFDEQGNAVSVTGFSQDVTQQRAMQLALEQLVQERTEELGAVNEELTTANEELAANNAEYTTLNDELAEANNLLKRSNDNLQQFAYIASHDLQEPLRKIQSFGDVLLKQNGAQLAEESRFMLQRMVDAGARMSTLVSDLLTFSRIVNRQGEFAPIPLQDVMDRVLLTLELAIEQAQAQISVGPIPYVNGDAGQLEQLLQNLISNAIKFTPAGQPPRITITYADVDRSELPAQLSPTSPALRFHQINVSDAGIGFDTRHLDHIFQVFQRLHGKNQYPGTGIGLAICQRVAETHGGVITASSEPGKGATFTVYLPG